MKQQRRQRLLRYWLVGLVFLVVAGLLAGWQSLHSPRAKAATPTNAELLLIHGYSDSCGAAFDYSNNPNYANPWGYSYNSSVPFASMDAWSYFNSHGWAGHIDKVGYYDGSHEFQCDHNASVSSDNPDVGKCSSLAGTDTYTNDPIRDLACKVAWYIYDNYTLPGTPVYVLAHSMGGLIIRDAIGEAGHGNSNFPPALLNVPRVVTVGTPHGGLFGSYVTNAEDYGGNTQEVADMVVGQPFMQMITPMQAPQGQNGTYWALMAGSNQDNGGTGAISSNVEAAGLNGPYPDGDGVVQADSALSMQANYKILYGKGVCVNACVPVPGSGDVIYPPSSITPTQYSHEADSCGSFLGITVCLATPFYLNDDSSAQTYAWICSSACNAGSSGRLGITDMGVVDSSDNPTTGQPAPHSLGEMLSLLPPPPPPPTPTPTNTPVPTCSVTNETDNIQPSNGTNPYVDNRGNTWYVYYDIKRDAKTNAPCQMQLVVRIFNPAPNGAWSGTASLYTLVNGNYDSASFGKVSGSCTYQYHFVWRGPWFKAGSAYYHLETFEYNGSNAYTRAWANFSI